MTPERAYERRRLIRNMQHLLKLHDVNAPQLLKAHALIELIVPSMMRTIGVEVCTTVIHASLLQALCIRTYTCTYCHKKEQDGDDMLCTKCRAEADQLCAEFDDEDEPPGYEESKPHL